MGKHGSTAEESGSRDFEGMAPLGPNTIPGDYPTLARILRTTPERLECAVIIGFVHDGPLDDHSPGNHSFAWVSNLPEAEMLGLVMEAAETRLENFVLSGMVPDDLSGLDNI